jgi:hypothetical protein
MNTTRFKSSARKTLIAAAVASALLSACACTPLKSDGAMEVRSRVTQLQADHELAAHRVYIADRKVSIAKSLAETRLAENQRTALTALGEKARLDARTRGTDAANALAVTARAESTRDKVAAEPI